MRFLRLVLLSVATVFGSVAAAFPGPTSSEAIKILPRQLGDFRQTALAGPKAGSAGEEVLDLMSAEYVARDGTRLLVEAVRFSQDSDAYSFLTAFAATLPPERKITREIGTASLLAPGSVSFFKGRVFVRVIQPASSKEDLYTAKNLALLLADRLENGEGDVPVLVKHLPKWEQAQERAIYFARFKSLKSAIANQPVLEAVTSSGDADAVIGNYNGAQLLIVEFNTPQLAGDNDRSITARIQELRSQGQPVPSAYRKTGNYSVFVFNSPTEQAANELIEQVKYEQVVQWLGDNPNLLERAQRAYYETTAGVLIAVLKASGLSLIACLAIGGFFGALLFSRRRAQQRAAEAYSDAGGMLRLNIDEMTPETNSRKLLGPVK